MAIILGPQFYSQTSLPLCSLRDKLDDLSRVILEPVQGTDGDNCLTIDKATLQFAQGVTQLADLRDWETHQIEGQIVSEARQYDQVCKALLEEVKINASIRNKEVLRKRAAEQKRGSTVLRADRDFEKIIEDFEEQKNKDLKQLVMNFVNIQLKVHLEGVNHLTLLYRQLKDIDCTEDAVKFRDSILESKDEPKIKSRSQSMGALNTLMHPSNPFRRLTTSGGKQAAERLNRSQEDILEAVKSKAPPKILLETEEETNSEEEEDSYTDRESSFKGRH